MEKKRKRNINLGNKNGKTKTGIAIGSVTLQEAAVISVNDDETEP